MEEGPLSPTAREKKGVNAPSAATPATREAKTIALADILQRGQNERRARCGEAREGVRFTAAKAGLAIGSRAPGAQIKKTNV